MGLAGALREARLTYDSDSLTVRDTIKYGLLLLALSSVTKYFIRKRQQQSQELSFSLQHGCQRPKAVIPSSYPFGLDLILLAFRQASKRQLLKFFTELVMNTGDNFDQNLLGVRGLDTVDPRIIEAVLSTQFEEFGLGQRRPCFAPLLGDGIFTQQAQPWKHSREILKPLFSMNRASNFDLIHQHVEDLLDCLEPNSVVDLQPLFFRLTLDTTTVLLFGTSINSLRNAPEDESEFAKAFNLAQDRLCQRGRLGDFYWVLGGKDFRNACKTCHSFIDNIVQEELSREDKDDSRYSVLKALIQETRDPQVLRDQLLNVLLAGRDTTACCLSWCLRLLCRHQAILNKLRLEVDSIVGVGTEAKLPTRDQFKKMTYLNQVLRETLRLYPSVPINSRSALKMTTLPTGGGEDGKSPILLREGEAVGYCAYAMHRRKDLYGEDAEEFIPERWDDGKLKHIGWGYLPFNGGPRLCLGQDFALLEAAYAVIRILQTFPSLELPDDEPTIEEVPVGSERQDVTLVVASADGCRVKLGDKIAVV